MVISIQFSGVDDIDVLNERKVKVESRLDRCFMHLSQREFNATFLLINLINARRYIAKKND